MNSKFIVIEYDVLDNVELSNAEKILYGYIVALSQNEQGICFASTRKLSELMGIKERQLLRCLAKLKSFNYISTTVINNNKRIIKPTINKFIEKRIKDNDEKIKNKKLDLFDYDWLDDEDEE